MTMCEGCTADEHWRCGMQTWCECECDGLPDWGMFDPSLEEEATHYKQMEQKLRDEGKVDDECCHFQD